MKKVHGRRVICFGKRGTLIHEGSEQSEISFDDGTIQIVVNDWITDIEPSDQPVKGKQE